MKTNNPRVQQTPPPSPATALAPDAETVETAMELFWRDGYQRTGIENIVSATGVNRYTIYKKFGGKTDLFLATLDFYFEQRKAVFLKAQSLRSDDPFSPIRSVADFCITESTRLATGCLIFGVAAEAGHDDPRIACRIEDYKTELLRVFETALSRADGVGFLNPHIAPKSGAALLVTALVGVSQLSKSGCDPKFSHHVIESLIAVLRQDGQD